MLFPKSAPTTQKSGYRPEVDGLRAIAIIPVIINHFHKDWLPSGFLGVDIFFVISGLVITSSLRHQVVSSFQANLIAFYSRRVKRLLPALCALIIVGAVLISLFNPYPGFSLQTGVAALFGFSNLYLFFQSTDYFAPSAEMNIFTHTWSLGVEEQFYLVFPLLLWIAGPWRTGAGFTEKNRKKIALTILSLSISSLLLFVSLSRSNPSAAYFLMPTRFWEMGAGCLLALGSDRPQPVAMPSLPWLKSLSAWFVLAAILAAFKVFAEEDTIVSTISIVALTCALIVTTNTSVAHEKNRFCSLHTCLSHPFLIGVGLLSYSLYLWHWPVICISRWTIGTPVWSLPFQLALIVVLSLISYRYVEQPLRKAVWSLANGGTIVQGLLAASLSAGFLVVLGGPFKGKLFTGKGGAPVETDRLASTLIDAEDGLAKKVDALLRECNATPFLLGVKSYSLSRKLDQGFINDCLELVGFPSVEQRSGGSRLILLGDSFAEKFAPFAALAARKIGYNFHVFYGYGCPYLLRSDLIKNPSFPHCRYLNEEMLEQSLLSSIKPGDIVVLRLHTSSKSYVRYPSGSEQPTVDAYDRAVSHLRDKIQARKASFLLVGGNPNLSTQEIAALRPDWFNALNRSDSINPRNSQETKFFHDLDRHLSQRYGSKSGGIYFSLEPYVCSENSKCLLSIGDKFLYQDDHHLSPFGHELFFQDFVNRIKRLAALPVPQPT